MAVQTTEEFLNGGATSYPITIEYLKTSDVKVRINGALQTYVASSPSTGEYTVSGTTVTLGAQAASGTGNVHIYRETNVNTPAAVFQPGSSIRAADLNAIHDMARFASVEHRNDIITDDIRDAQITSAKILDGTIVDADINASAAIAQTKIATGTLPSGIQVASANIVNGTIVNDDVSNSANIDGSKIADASIPVAKIASGTLPSNTKITTTNIEDGTIANVDIASNAAIAHSKLALDIVNSDINSSADIAGSKLADGSVGLGKLGTGALPTNITVNSSNIVNDSIVNADIKSDAGIAFTKLQTGTLPADRKVNSDNIVDGSIVNADINASAEIQGSKLLNDSVTLDKLGAGNLPTDINVSDNNIVTGTLDNRYYTETELDAGQLDNRYFTETELTGGALDGRYYTETEAEAKFLRQDSSETIASGVSWSNSDAHVATTAAINARIIDLIDEVGGFTAIANQTSFPTTNPQGATGQAAILSIAATTATLTPSGTTITIPNGAGTGNTVTITGVPTAIPVGFGFLVESTSTTHTYSFHRLVPIATQVNTVAQNITNIVQAGINVADINNFADIYIISSSEPTQRNDGTSLQEGDLWFDSSNDNLQVYTGSAFAIITPSQSVLDDVATVSGAITYSEDLGLITNPVATGSSNGSLDIVADALEDERIFTVTASGGAFLIDGVSKPALTLHKGWTYTFDVSDSSNGSHPFRFYAGSSQYSTNVTVTGTQGNTGAKVQIVIPESQPANFQYYCTNHSGMGNTITVVEDPIKAVADIASSVVTVGGIASNVTTVANNTSNINAVQANESNINAVQANASNINAAVSNASNINAVVSNATNINTVAGNNSNVTTVANNTSNINSAVSNQSNINAAVSNATNINTVSGSINAVNRYANEYKISSSAPGSPSAGDLWFDTVNATLKNYNGNAWLGITSNSGIQNVIDDTSPELAAALDCNNNNLTEVGTVSGDNLQIDFGTL